MSFLIAQDWYEHWLVHPFCRLLGCIPVRRDGHDVSATRAALRALGEGRVVPIFPEGRIIPKQGKEFGEGKPGAAFLALHTDAPVIPAYISGAPPTANIMKSWVTPSRSRVVFGTPLDLSRFRGQGDKVDRSAVAEVSALLMNAIRGLARDEDQDQDEEDWPADSVSVEPRHRE